MRINTDVGWPQYGAGYLRRTASTYWCAALLCNSSAMNCLMPKKAFSQEMK